jgi:hypothetical protein
VENIPEHEAQTCLQKMHEQVITELNTDLPEFLAIRETETVVGLKEDDEVYEYLIHLVHYLMDLAVWRGLPHKEAEVALHAAIDDFRCCRENERDLALPSSAPEA